MTGASKESGEGTRARLDVSGGGQQAKISDTLKKPLIKRFYRDVSVGGEKPWHILLDGRAVKTPGKRPLALPTLALADGVAEEWRAQHVHVDPATMPLTRFANTAIDAVADAREDVAADIVAYAGSDLICYRAESPQDLVRAQEQHWDPVLAWARQALGARFVLAEGVMPVRQSEAALAAVGGAIASQDAFRLTGLHVVTTLTGSALLALALERGALSGDAVWAAAHVDEDHQLSLWGEDAEAAARRLSRRSEFDAAVRWLKDLG